MFSLEKKKKVTGFFLIVFALLLFLSILSYSKYDKANLALGFTDLFKIFSDDPEFLSRAASVHNWLGLFGAYLSDFLINSTLGYFSIVFPIIMFLWGYVIFKGTDSKQAISFSNISLSFAVIISSFFGMLREEMGFLVDNLEVSGKIGDFLGGAFGRLLGGLGSSIFFISLILVVLFVAFDVRIERIFDYLASSIKGAFSDEESEENDGIHINKPQGDENLEKIKKISKIGRKWKKGTTEEESVTEVSLTEEDAEISSDEISVEEASAQPETTIRIIKKEEGNKLVEAELTPEDTEPQIVKEEKSKSKSADEIIPAVDKEKEAELPNQWEEKITYKAPKLDLLEKPHEEDVKISEEELKHNAELLKEKLALFDIKIEDISVTPGPVVTLYEIVPAPGVKISRIVSLEHDIALALAARGIRIIAPIPGKSAIGVEIPNADSTIVKARSVISMLKNSKAELPIALGKTIVGEVYIADLAKMPHLLVAGATGSGKSVGINMLITSLIYAKHPSEIKFVIVDPKKIELSFYAKLNKHFLAVSPDLDEEIITQPSNALLALKSVEYEMEKRYDKLAKVGVRNIVDYNIKIADPKKRPADTETMKHYKMPYIVVIIDELADLMMTSGKEVEEPIARLAQLARAVGIHLVVATQRPSVNVITGVIKANFPARIAYQVATKIDSRTILDMNGAEQLLGRGDMLFLPGGMPKPVRIQNAFITTEEVEKVTDFVYVQKGFSKRYFLPSLMEKNRAAQGDFLSDLDPMFEDAARVIVRHQQGSVSLLQRKLKLGYSRAARIVDQLEQAGIVGPSEGSKAREVICESEDQLESIMKAL